MIAHQTLPPPLTPEEIAAVRKRYRAASLLPGGSGHFGLLNMQQRAEAIGAILDVRRWPAGGTHVALDWRAR